MKYGMLFLFLVFSFASFNLQAQEAPQIKYSKSEGRDKKFYKQVEPLVNQFVQGLLDQDGTKWENMCDPGAGFVFRYLGQYNVRLTCPALGRLFKENNSRWWGRQDGTGKPITGNFGAVWYDKLSKIAKSHDIRGVNIFVNSGNAVDKMIGKLPFIDLAWSGSEQNGNMDWQSVRLFFQKSSGRWYLQGLDIYHWTI
ncbi:MAG: hypothetical protein Q7T03_09295 [Deltaproteobacteria bacterium]|nr:hypothetical protein [Deltaproteobacteria bacterium]